jgi:hypothetical protein
MVNLFGKKPPMPLQLKPQISRNAGQKAPDRYAWANKKGGSYDVIDEEKLKVGEDSARGGRAGTLFKAAENIMNNRGGRNINIGGSETPDNFHSFAERQLGVTSEGGGDHKAPRRLPLQSFSSYEHSGRKFTSMTSKFAAPVDSLSQLKSYVANKRQNFKRIIAEKTLSIEMSSNSPMRRTYNAMPHSKTLTYLTEVDIAN